MRKLRKADFEQICDFAFPIFAQLSFYAQLTPTNLRNPDAHLPLRCERCKMRVESRCASRIFEFGYTWMSL